MSVPKKQTTFYANAAKGFYIKGIVDLMAGKLTRMRIRIRKDKIIICDQDTKEQIMFHNNLPREKFREYRCTENRDISVNIKHFQKMVKSVKKKESMILFIKKGEKKLGISIYPEGNKSGTQTSNSRRENIYITFQDEVIEDIQVDEIDNDKNTIYHHPKIIDASEFQKIKKLTTMDKVITVKMQGSNYISFYCDQGDVFSDELCFGEIIDSDDEDDNASVDSGSEDSDEEGEDDDIGDDDEEEGEEEDDDEVEEDKTTTTDKIETCKDWYEVDFYMNLFSLLVKLPGLCSQIQFYAPKIKGSPLKIRADAGTIGTISILIKDIQQITYEESCKNNNETIDPTVKQIKK